MWNYWFHSNKQLFRYHNPSYHKLSLPGSFWNNLKAKHTYTWNYNTQKFKASLEHCILYIYLNFPQSGSLISMRLQLKYSVILELVLHEFIFYFNCFGSQLLKISCNSGIIEDRLIGKIVFQMHIGSIWMLNFT